MTIDLNSGVPTGRSFLGRASGFETCLPVERTRLVRLCAWLTGEREAAEDLVQETLLIAWQRQDQLRDPARRPQWLAGIARNLCRHWARQRRREVTQRTAVPSTEQAEFIDGDVRAVAPFDLELELDRSELAHLLDRALALLPPLTRTVLVDRFIHDLPQAEVAQCLGLSEGAVEARVQRGKLTLRRLFTTELQEEAATYGFVPTDLLGWQETRIWCPACGERRLQGRFPPGEPRTFTLCCLCGLNFCMADVPGLFAGVQGFRAAHTRLSRWQQQLYQQGISTGQVACPRCGAACPFHLTQHPEASHTFAQPLVSGYEIACPACRSWRRQADLGGIFAHFPIVQQFWRDHPRMISLPLRTAEVNGAPVIIAGFADKNGSAQLELLVQQATLALLSAS